MTNFFSSLSSPTTPSGIGTPTDPQRTEPATPRTHPFLQLLVLVAAMLLMTLAAAAATMALAGLGVDTTGTAGLYLTQALSQIAIFMLPVLFIARRYYKDNRRGFYRIGEGRERIGAVATAVAVMLLLIPLNEWLTEWNDSWNLGTLGVHLRRLQDQTEAIVQQMLGTTSYAGLAVNLVVVALLPAVCEELFFRAGIQNLLQRWWDTPAAAGGHLRVGSHAAVIVGAVIFSLGHGELFSFVPRLLLGAALGYLYLASGSLLTNMAAHFANNALVVVLYWLSARGTIAFSPDEPMLLGWAPTLCCTLAAAALFAASFCFSGNTRPAPPADK